MEIEERNKTDGKVKLEWVLKLLFFSVDSPMKT